MWSEHELGHDFAYNTSVTKVQVPQPSVPEKAPKPERAAKKAVASAPARVDEAAKADEAGPAKVKRKGSEGFESTQTRGRRLRMRPPPTLPDTTALPAPKTGALAALHDAKEPGVYFRDHSQRGAGDDSSEDPELAAAVEEAIRLLFGVRGIHHIAPGENQAHEPVVLIQADRGFTEAALQQVPEKVHRFPTLVVVPYELLPLRKS